MTLPRFAVIDIETSGLSTRRHRILQLALVTVDGDGEVLDSWSTYVSLRWPWQRVGPRQVHGITRSTLRGAPSIDRVLDEFARRVGDSVVTAHHAEFDTAFIGAAARRFPPSHPIHAEIERPLCTLAMSRSLDPERRRSHRLNDLCAHYGIALDRPHDALADALATASLVPLLLDELDVSEREQLEPFYVGPAPSAAQSA